MKFQKLRRRKAIFYVKNTSENLPFVIIVVHKLLNTAMRVVIQFYVYT